MPRALSRRSSRSRRASLRAGRPGRRDRSGTARSHSRSRPCRPAAATSPRCTRRSSIIRDVPVVVPAARAPRAARRCRAARCSAAARRRAAARGSSRRQSLLASTQSRRYSCQSRSSPDPRPLGHLGAVERDVLGRPQRPGAARSAAARRRRPTARCGRVRRTQPAPQHQLGTRRDRAGRLELQQREPPDGLEQVGRPLLRQQLGPHGDAPRVGAAELVDGGHAASVEASTDDQRRRSTPAIRRRRPAAAARCRRRRSPRLAGPGPSTGRRSRRPSGTATWSTGVDPRQRLDRDHAPAVGHRARSRRAARALSSSGTVTKWYGDGPRQNHTSPLNSSSTRLSIGNEPGHGSQPIRNREAPVMTPA